MMNYFDILQIEHGYAIDKALMHSNYLELQKNLHNGQNLRINGRPLTSLDANEAYKTLADDYLRALYLLQLRNIIIDENTKNTLSLKELEALLDEHEYLASLQDTQDLTAYEQKILVQKNLVTTQLALAFDNNITKAVDLTIKLRYLTNLLRNIKLKIKDANFTN
jgi:Fe-S protein assembly co-chaperone HscB